MFEDEDNISDLEKFNRKRALTNTIVAEEHISLENQNISCSHIWCARKHMLMAQDHLREAVEHTEQPDMRPKYKTLIDELEDWLEDGDVSQLREIRNRMRDVFKETSLSTPCDTGVCDLDTDGIEKEVERDRTIEDRIKSMTGIPQHERRTKDKLFER